jgi:hypothetical protein
MALFEYFPNYIWNLSVAIAMESGAQIGAGNMADGRDVIAALAVKSFGGSAQ